MKGGGGASGKRNRPVSKKGKGEQEKWGVRAKADGKNDDGPDKNQEPELNPVPS